MLVPQNMLRHEENVFLDDITVDGLEKALNVKVSVIMQDGFELLDGMLGLK